MTNFKKKSMSLLGLLFTIMVISLTSHYETTATAAEFTLSNEDLSEIKAALHEYGITEEVQESLIEKLENGEVWDCMNPEKTSQIPEGYLNVSIDDPIKRYDFPDGSFIETKLEIVKDDFISNYDITEGSTSSGTGYVNRTGVKITASKGALLGMGFFADFTHVQSGYDQISRVYDQWVKVIGGNASSVTLQIVKANEDSNGPAQAKLTAQVNWLGIGTSGTEWLYLNVGSDSAWSSEN